MYHLKAKSRDQDLLDRALLDCYVRFLVPVPELEFQDPIRLCFHIQDAWWWYIDHWYHKHPGLLSNYSFKSFLRIVSTDCELIKTVIGDIDLNVFENEWKLYRNKIPVRGGILINKTMDKVLLVKGFNNNQWTFPRGKADELEDDCKCAIREIEEETGIDVSKMINPNEFFELFINNRSVKLYIILNVEELPNHKPKMPYEISECKWFNINCLKKKDTNSIKTFNVLEFIPNLISYLNKNKKIQSLHQEPKAIWDPEEMFKTNLEKFGVVSTYKLEDYLSLDNSSTPSTSILKNSNDCLSNKEIEAYRLTKSQKNDKLDGIKVDKDSLGEKSVICGAKFRFALPFATVLESFMKYILVNS